MAQADLARLRRRLVVGDVVAVTWAVAGAHLTVHGWLADAGDTFVWRLDPTFVMASLGVGLAWVTLLWLSETRHPVVLGAGSEEYRRVLSATFRLVALVAVVSYLTQTPVGRGYLLLVIPVGLLALLANRWAWRRRLVHDRRRGADLQTAVVVGTAHQVADVERRLSQQPDPVWRIAARVDQPVLVGPSRRASDRALLEVESVLQVAREQSADTIIVAGGESLPPGALRELGWALRGSGVGLAVAPSVVDVAGPRIHVRPVAGLALLHLEEPSFTRGGLVLKRAVDVVGAALGLLLLAPVLLSIAVLVRATSTGPAIYRQQRVGYDGSPFAIWKFRTMADNADAELQRLLAEQDKGHQPLFKLDHDPRITRVGRVLRTYSLDEFPQLVNVLLGHMSLVGPRPQVDAEVAMYTRTHRRRLLAKPGMTGLWQVSGRNEVAWEDAAELDLYYVENWSLGLDVVLLLRTVLVVLRGARGGAR